MWKFLKYKLFLQNCPTVQLNLAMFPKCNLDLCNYVLNRWYLDLKAQNDDNGM